MLKRSHTCGELCATNEGEIVALNGWVDTRRDHGGLIFIDLRDRHGLTQVVFEPDAGSQLIDAARDLRAEYVIGVKGKVSKRLTGKENPKLKTGAIEVRATELEVFNTCPPPPFEITASVPGEPNEELRLTYRYLDLRRPAMQQVLLARHRMAQLMRNTMSEMGFVEVETPILGRSTPEGARNCISKF
jgi:aspartyl-tRNA synthetase